MASAQTGADGMKADDIVYETSKADALVGKALEADQPLEDFLDPRHPQYGSVDEHGRPLPGWLDQITVRCAPFHPLHQ